MSFWIGLAVLIILACYVNPYIALVIGMLWVVAQLCSEKIDLEATFNRLFGRMDRIVEMMEKKQNGRA